MNYLKLLNRVERDALITKISGKQRKKTMSVLNFSIGWIKKFYPNFFKKDNELFKKMEKQGSLVLEEFGLNEIESIFHTAPSYSLKVICGKVFEVVVKESNLGYVFDYLEMGKTIGFNEILKRNVKKSYFLAILGIWETKFKFSKHADAGLISKLVNCAIYIALSRMAGAPMQCRVLHSVEKARQLKIKSRMQKKPNGHNRSSFRENIIQKKKEKPSPSSLTPQSPIKAAKTYRTRIEKV